MFCRYVIGDALKGINVARIGTVTQRRRWGTAAIAILVPAGLAAWSILPRSAVAAHHTTPPRDLTIASPRPFFIQLSGQGPAMANGRVVWTAINAQGQAGSQADGIYVYAIQSGRLGEPIRSRYGKAGFIGSYALVGDDLAYVDTGLTKGGLLTWRIAVTDLRTNRSRLVMASAAGGASHIPPQIAFDGSHVLVLQTIDSSASAHVSSATLYSLDDHSARVLLRRTDVLFGDPAFAHDAALWTAVTFTPRPSSRLTMYDLARRALRTLSVGDVSQLAASGDLVVWKSGLSGLAGRIALYSLHANRVLAANLAGGDRAIFPTTDGRNVAWTYGDGSRVQIYNIGAHRVIYNAPAAQNRVYGLTALASHTASWTYTVIASSPKGASKGFVVVHAIAS